MDLHNLDGSFEYSVPNVNHTAVIIYGSFDNELEFLETSGTLYAFQDTSELARQGQKKTWPIRQPGEYAYRWWPTEVSLQYLPNKILLPLN